MLFLRVNPTAILKIQSELSKMRGKFSPRCSTELSNCYYLSSFEALGLSWPQKRDIQIIASKKPGNKKLFQEGK